MSYVACVQTSPISFHPRKRDVCETASLIVFQYPAVFQEFLESAFIGCLTIATVRNNSDWLSSGNARDNVCDLHLAGFSIDQNRSHCVLCFSTILKNNDRNLVKSRGEFKVQEEILSLQFIVHETSPYICRSCVGKLRKRRGLYANVRKIEVELFSGARGAPWVRKFGNPLIPKILVLTSAYVRPSVRTDSGGG